MATSDDFLQTETLFNSGITIALEIAYYVRKCGAFAFHGQYDKWYRTLQVIERRMEKKFRDNKKAQEELREVHKGGFINFVDYQRKKRDKIKLDYNTLDKVKQYLSNYERSIIYWRDKFGYGMPEKDDVVSAAWK